MQVATLYDLHGNLRALEAVLDEIPAEATIVVGGDVCAGGIYPSETLERMIAPMVEAGVVRCARCGELIEPGTPCDLGHVDGTERTVYSGATAQAGKRLSRRRQPGDRAAQAAEGIAAVVEPPPIRAKISTTRSTVFS